MRQFLLALTFSFAVLIGGASAFIEPLTAVHAQEPPIELNFGSVAKDKAVIGTENYDPTDGEAGFGRLVSQILNIVVVIGALLVFIYLIWGGIEWISAGGDKSKIEKARNRITQSVLGLVVLAAMLALFALLQTALGFEIFSFS